MPLRSGKKELGPAAPSTADRPDGDLVPVLRRALGWMTVGLLGLGLGIGLTWASIALPLRAREARARQGTRLLTDLDAVALLGRLAPGGQWSGDMHSGHQVIDDTVPWRSGLLITGRLPVEQHLLLGKRLCDAIQAGKLADSLGHPMSFPSYRSNMRSDGVGRQVVYHELLYRGWNVVGSVELWCLSQGEDLTLILSIHERLTR